MKSIDLHISLTLVVVLRKQRVWQIERTCMHKKTLTSVVLYKYSTCTSFFQLNDNVISLI